jgi:hypothetical protein
MSDGPFKNLKLGKRWKRFFDAVQNETFNSPECCAMASHALMHEFFTDNVRAILAALQANANRKQLDLDPLSSVESIFNDNMKTPFSDTLQKQLAFRLNDQVSPADAVQQALEDSVVKHSNDAKDRIVDECLRAREAGEIRHDLFYRSVSNIKASFDALAKNKVCDALLDGNKNAFKDAVSKKQGIDEGPPL